MHILQGLLQAGDVKVAVKDDQVAVSEHDHRGVDAQVFLAMAVAKTVGDDQAGFCRDITGGQSTTETARK
jgi:hypothetical protein